MTDLLALSFLQPWLWAILEGHKGFRLNGARYAIENRPWKPWPQVLGQSIALHASLGHDLEGVDFINRWFAEQGNPRRVGAGPQMPRGAIVGTARVLGALLVEQRKSAPLLWDQVGPVTPEQRDQVLTSAWTFGPWAWLLADVQKLPHPIPCRGALGLWRVPPAARALLSPSEPGGVAEGGTGR